MTTKNAVVAPPPGDAAIVLRLKEILVTADLAKVSAKDIRLQIEREMGVSLGSKKAFIRDHIASFMEESGEADGGGDGDDDSGAARDSSRLKDRVKTAIQESVPSKEPKKKTGFQKPCQLSDELESIVGVPQAPRSQVVKVLWAYIHEHNLQLPENKKIIRCDEALKKVFGSDQVDMFSMHKKLTKHIIPLDELAYNFGVARAEKRDARDEEAAKTSEAEQRKTRATRSLARKRRAEQRIEKEAAKQNKKDYTAEKKKVSGRGFNVPTRLSPKLREFLGTNETELPRPDVTKLLWEYIKTNQLQDPNDRRQVLCDEKLESLLGCKSFGSFGPLTKLLQVHLGSTKNKPEE